MSKYLRQISATPDDLTGVADAVDHFENEYLMYSAKISSAKGRKLVDVGSEIPDMAMKIYDRWVELNAIYDLIEIRKEKLINKRRKFYIEKYPRELNASQIQKFAESDDDVLIIMEMMIEINLIRNRWEGLSKALEKLHQQVRILMELRKAGLDEHTI